MPPNSLTGYAPELNPEIKKGRRLVLWFAVNDDRSCSHSQASGPRKHDPRYEIEAYPRPARPLWLPDHLADRGRRADPSKAAGDLDHRGGVQRLDARALGRGEGVAAATPNDAIRIVLRGADKEETAAAA